MPQSIPLTTLPASHPGHAAARAGGQSGSLVVSEAEGVRIFLEFELETQAALAFSKFNGRFFGGKSVKARFFGVERYKRGDLLGLF